MSYQCPLCHQPLLLRSSGTQQQGWYCAANHQFDCAREGYVNLLPVQHKRSKQPGDNTEMMQARRAFLDAGHYQPLQQRVVTLLEGAVTADATTLLDIGCGEGYYTAAVSTLLNQQRQLQVFGLDVAKVAIRYGARRYPRVQFCVGSSRRLPFEDHSLDVVLCIYAPYHQEELLRTLKPGGVLLIVSPGPRHLYQLKAAIYPQAQLHQETATPLPGFTLMSDETLAYQMQLTGGQVSNLLQMTPFAWRVATATREMLAQQASFHCETEFVLRLYRRFEDQSSS